MGIGKSSHEGKIRNPYERSKDSQGRTPAERGLDKRRTDSLRKPLSKEDKPRYPEGCSETIDDPLSMCDIYLISGKSKEEMPCHFCRRPFCRFCGGGIR